MLLLYLLIEVIKTNIVLPFICVVNNITKKPPLFGYAIPPKTNHLRG